jgi:hypothetical protein
MKRKEETGKGLERGVYTAEELAVVEAASGWSAVEFADVPLRVGWLLEKKYTAGRVAPSINRRSIWTVQRSDGSLGEDLYSAGAARDWAATYRRWNPSPPAPPPPPTPPLPSGPGTIVGYIGPKHVPRHMQWGVTRPRKRPRDFSPAPGAAGAAADDTPLSPAAVCATPDSVASLLFVSESVFPLVTDIARGEGHHYGIVCACKKRGLGGCFGPVLGGRGVAGRRLRVVCLNFGPALWHQDNQLLVSPSPFPPPLPNSAAMEAEQG